MALLKAPNFRQHCRIWPQNTLVHIVCNFTKHTPHTSGSQSKCECVSLSRCFCKFQRSRGWRLQRRQNQAEESLAGWGQSANSWVCSLLAPVANTFPPVTQSHVRQENENCYCSGSLHLNQRRANFQLGQRNVQLMKTSAPPSTLQISMSRSLMYEQNFQRVAWFQQILFQMQV